MTADQIRQLLRARYRKAGSQSALADELGITQAYLSYVMSGQEPAGKLLKALGLERVVTYRKLKPDGEVK